MGQRNAWLNNTVTVTPHLEQSNLSFGLLTVNSLYVIGH